MKTATYLLPAYWAVYLFNGDDTGLSDAEVWRIDHFMQMESLEAPIEIDVENVEFSTTHDAIPYGELDCDCAVYTFPVSECLPAVGA